MDRIRSLAMVGGTVLIALGAGQYMKSGSAASSAALATVPETVAEPVPEPTRVALRVAAATPLAGYEVLASEVTRSETTPDAVIVPAPEQAVAESCPVALDLFADADAMLSLTLTAPCHPNEGVILRHAGLSVTYLTTATGSLFIDIPALDDRGEITVRFTDGTEVTAAAAVPELVGLRRFAVQWIDGDSFNLATEAPVVALGTAATALPMYAQVATLAREDTLLAIEAPVTDVSCGRAALGEALFSESGKVAVAELTMAMPECDAEGGFVVLNNPLADMKLAAAE